MNRYSPNDIVATDAEVVLNLLLSGSEYIFYLVDRDLTIRYLNDTAKKEAKKLLGIDVCEGDTVLALTENETKAAFVRKMYDDVFRGQSFEAEDEWFVEGKKLIYQYRLRPAKNSSGDIVAAVVTIHNITEKTRMEAALHKSEERLRLALEGTNYGIWDWDIPTGNVHFSSSWRAMLGFEEADIQNNIKEWEKRIHPDDKAQLAHDLKAHFSSASPIYENTYRLLANDNTYRWIRGRGKIAERAPDGTPLRMIGTHRDITEKIASEEEYRNLFDLIPMSTWIYDFDTMRFLAVNKAAIKQYGYTKEEFLQMRIFDINPAVTVPHPQQDLYKQERKDCNYYPGLHHTKKDGTLIIADVHATTIFYQNRKARLVVLNDITEKAKAEEELRNTNQLFQYVTKATSDAIYDLNTATGTVMWSEGLTALFGHSVHDVNLKKWESFIHPDDCNAVLKSFNDTYYHTRKKLWKCSYRFRRNDGTYRCVIDKGFILRDAENKPYRMIGAMQDITDLNQKQFELIESNKRYEYATLAASDMIWDWDLATQEVLWSDNYKKLMGWPLPENNRQHISVCMARFHEADRERISKSMHEAFDDKTRTTWEGELRYCKASGEYAHVHDRGYILRDEKGKAVRMIGAMQDNTDRKRLEEQLLQKELDKQKVISKATIDTQERERTEIGKELHDNVNQVLTTTKLYLELALSNAEMKDELLEKSQKNIMYVINEIRQLSRSLMNPSLGDLGLIDSVTDLVESVRATGKLNIVLQADENVGLSLPDNLDVTIYRIIQEALNNVVKHAAASTVLLQLRRQTNGIELIISDDGIGFEPEQIKTGAGLKSIKNRVYLSNGELQLKSAPGNGCSLAIQFTL